MHVLWTASRCASDPLDENAAESDFFTNPMNDEFYGSSCLRFSEASKFEACNAGLFVSPAHGIHPERVIDSYELILVRTGTLVLGEETTVFALEQGDTLILWPGRVHRGVAPYASNTSFYWVHFYLGTEAADP